MKYKAINIPKDLHKEIKVKCSGLEISITEFVVGELKKSLSDNPAQKPNICPDCSSDPCKCPDWMKNKPEDCPDCGNDPCICDWKKNPVEELPESTEDDIFGGVEEGISGRKDKISGAVEFDGGEE